MTADRIKNEYFEWMYKLVCGNKRVSFRKLLYFLHSYTFDYSIAFDANRAGDGVDLRYLFGEEKGYSSPMICAYLDNEECSVLEMMVALSNRCERTIMDNPEIGDRTGIWFFKMIESLGLLHMNDNHFNKDLANDIIENFINRNYKPNGEGGLFTIRSKEHDMRTAEIWYQMMWFLNEVNEGK